MTTTAIESKKDVDCTKVQGRRALSFGSLEEALAEAEGLVAVGNVKMLGNHSLGQLLAHLGIAIDSSIDGFSGRAPWFIRLATKIIKGRILKKGTRPGFRLTMRRGGAANVVLMPASSVTLRGKSAGPCCAPACCGAMASNDAAARARSNLKNIGTSSGL